MIFIALLILTTLSIAGAAAFFSVYGLGQIFTGSFWPVVVMGSTLEVGKLVTASYVYRYWKRLSFLMKSYMISAVVVLMLITSAGIFGFLSAAYQQDILPLQQSKQQIVLLQEETDSIQELREERVERRKQIDADIANLPNNFVTGRQRLMESYGPELETIRADIEQYTKRLREITLEIQELKQGNLEQEAHIGPIIFIAEVFNSTTDIATKWVIMLIIFAFDPLAVALTIGANIAILERGNPRDDRMSFQIEKKKESPTLVIHQGMGAEELQKILDDRFSKHDMLTPEEKIQKQMLEEAIAKKKINQKIRTGNS